MDKVGVFIIIKKDEALLCFSHCPILHEALCFLGELCNHQKPLEMNTYPNNLLLLIISIDLLHSLFRV